MQTHQRLPLVAAIIALLISGVVALEAILGSILALPLALIPLCAGIGILRKRVWSAYGLALYYFAQIVAAAVLILTHRQSTPERLGLAISAICSVLLGVLFLLTGRPLAASGAARGRALPWIALATLSIVPFFFFQTFQIPGASMEGALLPGDRIIAQTFPVPTPERGKIILFTSPQDHNLILAKRVIAIPGDRIRMIRETAVVNGVVLKEAYVTHRAGETSPYSDDLVTEPSFSGCSEGHEEFSQSVRNGEVYVPQASYFVLGDLRDDSLDSRCWGFVRSSDVIGRPLMIYESTERADGDASEPNPFRLGPRRWNRLLKCF